jgi:hypothetical protein
LYLYDNGNNGSESEDYGNFISEPPNYKEELSILSKSKSTVNPLYLEDVMNSSDLVPLKNNCYNNKCSGKIVGQSCDYNSPNPQYGYKRTFGGSELIYNDNLADPLFKSIQYIDGAIKVPWSNLYNNKSPSNPTIR